MIEWNVDPVLFTLGPLSPRWYGLLWACAFLVSYWIMKRIFVAEGKPLKALDSLTMYMIVATILGARIGHVLFYEPDILFPNPLELFAIWHGGLASHGGALGIILGLWLFHRRYKEFSFIWLLDRLSIVAAVSGAVIRVGNLMNSEIVGKPTDGSWGFWFMRIDQIPIYRHPTQLYEAALGFIIFGVLYWLYNHGTSIRWPGRLIGLFLVLQFTGRFVIEFFKEHQVAFESALPMDMGQLLSVPFVAVGLWLIYRSSNHDTSAGGVTT